MRYVYLHGFASSPLSRKARAFREALAARGIKLEVPELEQGDFEHMTITSQLAVMADALKGAPARLIGSSMGGYLAALYAAGHPEIDRLVLLAPAFGFAPRWISMLGGQTGPIDIYHYGSESFRQIRYELLSDALTYAPEPPFTQPAMIFHGVNDTTVPVGFSRKFAAENGNAVLREMESDHELGNVLDTIVHDAVPFLTG